MSYERQTLIEIVVACRDCRTYYGPFYPKMVVVILDVVTIVTYYTKAMDIKQLAWLIAGLTLMNCAAHNDIILFKFAIVKLCTSKTTVYQVFVCYS